MTKETREPQKHTGFLLRRAQQQHVATWQSVIDSDTTNVQYGVLAVLARRPGIAQKDICDELDLDRFTIADICARMEKSGLVTRTTSVNDKRRNVLSLTEAGKHEHQRLEPFVEEVQRKLLQGLTDEEHETLRELLIKLLPSVQ
jgi:DNA-binding MarR family transcriptional regulator